MKREIQIVILLVAWIICIGAMTQRADELGNLPWMTVNIILQAACLFYFIFVTANNYWRRRGR